MKDTDRPVKLYVMKGEGLLGASGPLYAEGLGVRSSVNQERLS